MNPSEYLDQQYALDQAAVKDVQAQADSALRTLENNYLGDAGWPYALIEGQEPEPERRLSQSTSAMILHAVAVAYGVVSKSVLVPAVRTGTGTKRDPADVITPLRGGVAALAKTLGRGGKLMTKSGTWGPNDPLTLTWLYELLAAGLFVDEAGINQGEPHQARIKTIAEDQLAKISDTPESVLQPSGQTDDYPVHHPFLLLRWVQLARAVKAGGLADLPQSKLPAAFLNLLRTELSNSDIRDGGYDPACLVFALEGLMTISPSAITEAMLDQVVEVLGRGPSMTTHWRPVRPMAATPRGLVLLPQSVEVANSFLRLCDLKFTQRITAVPLFTRSFEMLQSYTDWLLSRSAQVRVKPDHADNLFRGWQSEHTYQPNMIHLWATSQAVLFLQHYSAMLQQHIARASRIAGNMDFRPQETPPDKSAEAWGNKRKWEPMFGLDPTSKFRAYDRIDKFFVRPAMVVADTTPRRYSILLYGPPGTGKTSFAKAIAEALNYDLIIVSPSDFIRGGEADVEARAKRIFDVLLAQSNTVILFDEIDRLLLDRDSPVYAAQADMFQFMTPSMLTKINDLREKERTVFVIATNYAERIDSAIKRPGRIDEQIVLLPPDLAQRTNIITKCAADLGLDELKNKQGAAALAQQTPLYIYSELKFLVQTIAEVRMTGKDIDESTTAALDQAAATTISLPGYKARFFAADPSSPRQLAAIDGPHTPWTEFALLAYLKAEVGHDLELDWAPEVLKRQEMLKTLDPKIRETIENLWV